MVVLLDHQDRAAEIGRRAAGLEGKPVKLAWRTDT